MPYQQSAPSTSRIVGIGIVILIHIAIVYALVNGLARRAVDVVRAPIVAKIITPPPPREAPPPPPPLAFAPPPPVFVPPPEVRIAPSAPSAAAPTAITTVPPPAPATAAPARILPHIDTAHSRQPAYPLQSRELGEQGSVVLQVLVDTEGKVIDTKLVQSSGFARLDAAALAGVKTDYRFIPGSVAGKPTPMWYTFRFNWKLT